jgi:hypothetical protein
VISFLLTPDLDLFRQAVDRLGGDLTGIALSEIYLAKDKMIEQIYENVVVSAPLEQIDQVTLRPLPSLLPITPGVPEPANNLPLFVFYPIQEQQGYNIPAYFLHYANLHGGLEVIGAPISRLIPVDENVFRQCFTNLCLEEHRNTPKGLLIRPAALGYLYKERYFDPGSADLQNRPSQEITLQIWEGNPRVASNQEQEIEVSVQQNGLPLSGAQPVLTLTLPDGSQQVLTFPPTGEDGHSLLRLPPITSDSGTLIRYQICLAGQTSEHFCVKNEYLIWNHP